MSERSDPPKIVLYGAAREPYTEKVRRGLLLKQLPFELREPSGPEDYRRWNPETGLLPVLDLDGTRIIDSTRILERIDERFPEPPLLAPEPRTAEQQRQLEEWADESFLFYFTKWLRLEEEQEARRAAGLNGDRRVRLRALGAWLRAGGTWERPQTAILRQIGDRLDDLVKFLGARPFFYSDRPSMADLAVYGMLFTLQRESIPGSQRLLVDRAVLVDYMARIERATEA